MHARSSGHDHMTQPAPTPPDTPDGFARMTLEQRSDLHGRDVELYRRLAADELAAQVTA